MLRETVRIASRRSSSLLAHKAEETFVIADPSPPAGERQLGYLTETRLGWPVRGMACLERQPSVVFRSTCPDDRSCAVALVRSVEVDDVVLAATLVWTAAFDTPAEAQRRRDWLDADAVRRIHLGRYAGLFGPGHVTSAVETGLRIEEVRLEERRRLDDEAALLAREMAEDDVRESRKIACYFRERRRRFFIDLERGNGKELFWSIAFDEKWERDRFWDYFGWQRDRWPSFAEHLDGHDSRDLERLLVKEMFDAEKRARAEGVSAGGRRPLRFWRGDDR
jgi:hypothetical protein